MSNNTSRRALLAGAALSTMLSPAMLSHTVRAGDDDTIDMPALTVEAAAPATVGADIIRPGDASLLPAADGGAFLASQPGFSGVRMGGHGTDPVLRGLQGNQLNITSDGAYIFGGCPNRMDPPSSFAPPETFDQVTITRGYQSVTDGPGGPGGHIDFQRLPPALGTDKPYEAQLGGGYVGNGNIRDAFVDGAAAVDGAYLRAVGAAKSADNYSDGDGNEVRSAFDQRSLDLSGGYRWDSGASLSLGLGLAAVDDALFAGAGMDAPEDNSRSLRGRLTLPLADELFRSLRLEAYGATVDHVMDNYSLRTRTAPMALRVASDADTYGGRLALDIGLLDQPLTVGLDIQHSQRDALRYSGMSDANVNTLQSLLWPDTGISQIGLFGEQTLPLTADARLVLGVRYDRVEAGMGRAAQVSTATGRSPNDLYRMYYGTDGADRHENNVGGLIRYEQALDGDLSLHLGLSRSVRTADATERSIASDMMANSWVGNPGIDPEAHHQAEFGLRQGLDAGFLGGTVFVDRVHDYILRDTARGQDGVLLANGASIYRNVDALLSGFTVEGEYLIKARWRLAGNATYTYGENLEDDRPLAQIPPLAAALTLSYLGDGWEAGSTLHGALRQGRVDDDPASGSGLDAGKTPGWLTQDIFVAVDLLAPFSVRFGVTNLFDRTYAQHLNRSNAFDPTQIQVNEPGRSAYLRVSARF